MKAASPWEQVPFIRLLIPLITGILLALYFELPIPHLSQWIILGIPMLLVVHLLRKTSQQYKYRWVFGLLVQLCLVAIAYERTIQFNDFIKASHYSHYLQNSPQVKIQLAEPPIEKKKSYKANVKVLALYNEDSKQWITTFGKSVIYFQKEEIVPTLKYGDVLIAKNKFQKIKAPEQAGEFDYQKFMRYENVSHQAYLKGKNWQFTGENNSRPFYNFIYLLQNYCLETLDTFITDQRERGVAAALLLGYKHQLNKDLQQTYADAGAMHVLAVSGLHVGVIWKLIGILLALLFTAKFAQSKWGIIITLIGIWLFALVAGLPPSVCRSALMFSLVGIGLSLNRKPNPYNVLAASAFILLLINPYILCKVGFQLSYAAMVGIFFLQPKICNLLFFSNKIVDTAWQVTALSIAAQITTLPMCLYYFHQFPTYALLTNLAIIYLASIILISGMALFALAGIPYVSKLVSYLLDTSIWMVNEVLLWVQQLPFATLQCPHFQFIQVLFLYGFLIFGTLYFIQQKPNLLKLALLHFIALLLTPILF